MKTGDYETVYKDWEKRLSNGASENWLAGLENSIIEWQKSADAMDKKLINEGHLFSVFEKVEFRKVIRQRRALVEKVESLLEKYDNLESAPITKRGNPNFKPIDMPEGFYTEADRLKSEFPNESDSWIYLKLINTYFNGDKGKKSTIRRKLQDHWSK